MSKRIQLMLERRNTRVPRGPTYLTTVSACSSLEDLYLSQEIHESMGRKGEGIAVYLISLESVEVSR